MYNKYFTVEVKPTVPTVAAGQHAAFADGDVLFDWTSFDIPKGASKLVGVVMEVRSKGDAGATVNKFPIDLLFAKSLVGSTTGATPGLSDPVSLGTSNSAMTTSTIPTMIGHVEMAATGFAPSVDGTAICTTGRTPQDACNIVLEGVPESGTNVGYDKIWVGGLAKDAVDFTSLTQINNGTLDAASFTTNGTDPRLFLAVGDFVTATTTADTAVSKALGTVKSMTATNITIEETTENAIVNDDFIYNRNPIKLILSFEK